MELDIIRGVLNELCGVKPEISVLCCVRNHTIRILPDLSDRTPNCLPGTIAVTRKSLADKLAEQLRDIIVADPIQASSTDKSPPKDSKDPTTCTPEDLTTETGILNVGVDEEDQMPIAKSVDTTSTPTSATTEASTSVKTKKESITAGDLPPLTKSVDVELDDDNKSQVSECSANTEVSALSAGSGATGTTNTSGGSDLWSFSLCPEFCILGHSVREGATGRPSKITIIRDDLNLTSEIWGRVVFGLQHLDQVNNKTVILPAPLNYADKAYMRIKIQADTLLHAREAESQGDLKQVYADVNEELAAQLMRVPPNSFY